MSNKGSFRKFYSCERKTQFINEEEAKQRVTEIEAESGTKLRYYKCPNCGGYHLAKIKERSKK